MSDPVPELSVPVPELPPMRCTYLTCKSMQVYGEDFESDPEYQAGMVNFCCLQTMRDCGPDNQLASLELCSKPERACYREY